ncbi:MTH865 family protein [Halorubellus litoreus]|uniref:MTH865 family protein n=1 Tax=Halorubellus litoreus TaxID=755308 RepID=A0ABD5V7W0_9EURY
MPEDATKWSSVERDREAAERAVRQRLAVVLADVAFPVEDQLAVAAAVDAPHSQRVTVGDRRFTAMELAVRLEPYQDFPYESLDALVDDVVAGLREEELL